MSRGPLAGGMSRIHGPINIVKFDGGKADSAHVYTKWGTDTRHKTDCYRVVIVFSRFIYLAERMPRGRLTLLLLEAEH